MSVRQIYCWFIGVSLFGVSLAGAATPDDIERRALLAQSGEYDSLPSVNSLGTSTELAEAIDLDLSLLNTSSISGAAAANTVRSNLGVIQPLQGNSLAILSTGVAGTTAPDYPEPGTDFGLPGNGGFDLTELSLTLNVPPGPGNLSFNYLFLSTEYPDFIMAGFNDTFVATVTDANGSRVIASIEVDNAAFFPASVDRAGGSGFDLFTEDPSGVDMDFGATGLPDAGLTDYLLATTSFESAGQITITFSIQDVGDGILDSAVILDNLNVSNIEVVDVNRDLSTGANPGMLINGSVSTDPAVLSGEAPARIGAAADGVTRLLIRTRAGGAGEVTFSLVGGNAPQDGGLDQPGGSQRLQSVTVPVDLGSGFAFAVYRTPDEFNRGGDTEAERFITLESSFSPDSGGVPVEGSVDIKLVRPPLVLTHGLWSSPNTWTFPLTSEARFPVQKRTDYTSTNASRFSTNANKVPQYVQQAVAAYHLQNIAATQVDAIGHSMGGILGRIYSTSAGYERNENFNAGDLRKMFTLDTPHTGSPLPDLLIFLRDLPLIGGFIADKARDFGHPIDEGAIDDLAKHSPAIDAIQSSPVPAHALVGIGGSEALELIPGKVGAFFALINFFAATSGSDLFEGLQHDAIVGRLSQEGGMPNSAISVFGGGDGIHIGNGDPDGIIPGNTGSRLYSDRLIELLDTPVSSSSFAQFPATAGLPLVGEEVLADIGARLANAQLGGMGLVITDPAPSTVVTPGATIQVFVDVEPGITVDEVLIVGPGIAASDDAAPFVVTVEIPSELAGAFEISAIGTNSLNEFFTSPSLDLVAQPAASLVGIDLQPSDPILLGIGSQLQLAVLGAYDDGVSRDLTTASETTFTSLDETIVTVSAEGVLTSQREGITTVLAQNSGFQDSITVTVVPDPGALFSDGFEAGDVSVWSESQP